MGRAHKQEDRLVDMLGLCCDLYNAALQQRIEAYEKQGVHLSLYDQYRELTPLRADDANYARLLVDMMRLTALKRLDDAFKDFFRRLKKGDKPGFPRYKGKDRFDTLIFLARGWKIEGKKLIIKDGQLKDGKKPIILNMQNSLHLKGEVKELRLVKRGDRWWAHFLMDVGDAPEVKPPKNEVGIDLGLREFATLSTGETVEHPRFLDKSSKMLKRAQHDLSLKQKGSKNRAKAKAKVVRIHNKIRNRRQDFIYQTVATLIKEHDGFAIEDLSVLEMLNKKKPPKAMTKKVARGIRRGIVDSAWSLFLVHLENKAEEAGFPVVRVDPRNTSQMCSGCGTITQKTLKNKIHECPACGLVLDRDLNAAINILNKAKNDLGCRSVAGSGDGPVKGAEVAVK